MSPTAPNVETWAKLGKKTEELGGQVSRASKTKADDVYTSTHRGVSTINFGTEAEELGGQVGIAPNQKLMMYDHLQYYRIWNFIILNVIYYLVAQTIYS